MIQAKEFLDGLILEHYESHNDDIVDEGEYVKIEDVLEKMIEFAKFHVEIALIEAVKRKNDFREHCPDEAILNAYSLDKIK